MSKKEVLVRTDANDEGRYVSIYLPVCPDEREKNRLRLKHLMFEAEKQLLNLGTSPLDVARLLLPVEVLLDDPDFWQSQKESFALHLTPTTCRQTSLPSRVKEGRSRDY